MEAWSWREIEGCEGAGFSESMSGIRKLAFDVQTRSRTFTHREWDL